MLDFFDLLWIVGIADFVLKYITIALKCLIVALPKIILAVKSKIYWTPQSAETYARHGVLQTRSFTLKAHSPVGVLQARKQSLQGPLGKQRMDT
uniref:Ring finger protein, transmembrane 2 n=1 Tax=Homo sapiens TaxID=9606 RepID=A0A7I2V5U1_HUMAN